MKIDSIYILYENSGKYFNDYSKAFWNSKKKGSQKQVYYVFTPTMQKYKRVGELENACRKYFNNICGCDYYNLVGRQGFKQLNLIGEL